MNKIFWKGRKVLITGHTGFKGGWLSLWLQHLGADVVGISVDPPTTPSLYDQANVSTGMLSLREDIRDGEAIKKLFLEHKPAVVFHLAAQPLVRYSYREPVETYETNVMGTLHVMEGMRSIDTVRAAVMITTDKCYDNKEWAWGYRENEPMGGCDPYSSSKGAAELLIASYRDSYYPADRHADHKTAIASVRAGNVIGGGDWAEDRLIPDLIRAFQKGEQAYIRNPGAIRPWQHVLEPLAGYLCLAELLTNSGAEYAEAWNFGPRDEDARPVQWVVEQMAELWGHNATWAFDEGVHAYESVVLRLDCSKARQRLGWRPIWSLNLALAKIVEWYQSECTEGSRQETCMRQIGQYMRDLENEWTRLN